MTSQEMLKKYKALYKKKTGKEITNQEALRQATKLITLVKAVYQPIPKEALLDEFIKNTLPPQ